MSALCVEAPVPANRDISRHAVTQVEASACSTLTPTCRGSTEAWFTSVRVSSPVSGWQVNVRVVPTGKAIEESVDLAHEIFNRVFRRVPDRVNGE